MCFQSSRVYWFLLALAACGPGGSTTATDVAKLCASGPSMPSAPTALLSGKKMRDLALASTVLIYVDEDSGTQANVSSHSGTVHRVGIDGSNDIELHKPDSNTKSIWDVTIVGEVIYFLEQDSFDAATLGPVMRLMKMSLGGDGSDVTGTLLPKLYTGFLGTGYVASENALYMRVSNDGNGNGGVGRFNLNDNTHTAILAPAIYYSLFLANDAIYYLTSASAGDAAESRTLNKAPKVADATGTAITNVHCRGSFFVTSDSIFCGGFNTTGTPDGKPRSADLTKLSIAGDAPRDWLSLSSTFSGASAYIAAIVGDEAIVGLSSKAPLLAVTLSNGTARALACAQAPIDLDYGAHRPMLAASSTAVYWIAEGDKGSGPNTLFKANLH